MDFANPHYFVAFTKLDNRRFQVPLGTCTSEPFRSPAARSVFPNPARTGLE
jgi:hypothetical protein